MEQGGRAALVTRARITRLIRDVIYERADTRRPSPAAGAEKPPFLAIRHVSRLNQGNYGAKRSKRPLPLAKSHISRRDASDIDRVNFKTSDGAAREEILRDGLIKRAARATHAAIDAFPAWQVYEINGIEDKR